MAVTTGAVNEGEMIEAQVDEVRELAGGEIATVTADAGYAYAKVYDGLERRAIDPLIPTKRVAYKSRVPLIRFRYDARHDIVKCPLGKILRGVGPSRDGRYFRSNVSDCARCALRANCLPNTRANKTVVIPHDYPALLRARPRRARWSEGDRRLYQRHLWRSEGFHGEAKTWHGLGRAVRRRLDNMKIQAYLTRRSILSGSPLRRMPFFGPYGASASPHTPFYGVVTPEFHPATTEQSLPLDSAPDPTRNQVLQQPHRGCPRAVDCGEAAGRHPSGRASANLRVRT